MSEKRIGATREEQIVFHATLLVSINDKLRAAKLADDRVEVKKQDTAKRARFIDLEKAVKRHKPP